MPQVSSFAVADGSGFSVRTTINSIFSALASCNAGGTAPPSPPIGLLWVDTSSSPATLKMWDGTQWDEISVLSSSGPWAIVEPLADARYLQLTGGTLSGPLTGTSAAFTSLTVNGVNVTNASLFTTGSLAPAVVPATAVTQYQSQFSLAATQITSGQFANARIASSNVLQWQGLLQIAWGQITGTKNADQLEGYVLAADSYSANTIPLRDAGGYLWANYFNQGSINGENPPVSQVMVTNGSDNYLRKCSLGYFQQVVLTNVEFLGNTPLIQNAAPYLDNSNKAANTGFVQQALQNSFHYGTLTKTAASVLNFSFTPFPNNCFIVLFSEDANEQANSYVQSLAGFNNGNFTIYGNLIGYGSSYNPTITVTWLAIGN